MMAIPRSWREEKYRYRLTGVKCKKCGAIYFPRRMVCSKCKSKDMEEVTLPRRGTVETFSVVRVPPRGFEATSPYVIAIVKLENGVKVLGQLTDCKPGEVKVGMPVEVVFRKLGEEGRSGIIYYGYKFRPVLQGT